MHTQNGPAHKVDYMQDMYVEQNDPEHMQTIIICEGVVSNISWDGVFQPGVGRWTQYGWARFQGGESEGWHEQWQQQMKVPHWVRISHRCSHL